MIIGFDGIVKNNKLTIKFPTVKVVYEKSVKPEPRLYIKGGLTKIDTSRKTHQTKLMARKREVKKRRARTLQRLYGVTYTLSIRKCADKQKSVVRELTAGSSGLR